MDLALDVYVHVLHIYCKVFGLTHPSALTVQGNSISLTSGQTSYSAIDTGTTLIGGPQEAIAEIYSNIPDSSPATGNLEGYYTYRESTLSPTQVDVHDNI